MKYFKHTEGKRRKKSMSCSDLMKQHVSSKGHRQDSNPRSKLVPQEKRCVGPVKDL